MLARTSPWELLSAPVSMRCCSLRYCTRHQRGLQYTIWPAATAWQQTHAQQWDLSTLKRPEMSVLKDIIFGPLRLASYWGGVRHAYRFEDCPESSFPEWWCFGSVLPWQRLCPKFIIRCETGRWKHIATNRQVWRAPWNIPSAMYSYPLICAPLIISPYEQLLVILSMKIQHTYCYTSSLVESKGLIQMKILLGHFYCSLCANR